LSRDASDLKLDKGEVVNLANKFHKLELMLSQSPRAKDDDFNIPHDVKFINDPAY
jgi:hypothetical protein